MTDDQRRDILSTLSGLKDRVKRQEGFLQDPDLKAIYVIVSTAEGAVLFDDIDELARLCAGFAGKKAEEMELDDDPPPPLRVIGS